MRHLLFLWLLSASAAAAIELPAFQMSGWLNAPPALEPEKFTLLFVFTRDCGNCHRSHPFINAMQARYGNKVRFIGVHSPEFSWEKDIAKLRAYAERMAIRYPVYRDDDMRVWNALDNRYWPAFFLFDNRGKHVATFVGETHPGDGNAQRIEEALKRR